MVVTLTPVLIAFYGWLAERRRQLGAEAGVHGHDAAPADLIRAHQGVWGLPADAVERLQRDTADGYIPQSFIELRKSRTMPEIAEEMGVPRTTLNDWMRRIRQRFEQAGLRNYLK